jgi:hypothetical protein
MFGEFLAVSGAWLVGTLPTWAYVCQEDLRRKDANGKLYAALKFPVFVAGWPILLAGIVSGTLRRGRDF